MTNDTKTEPTISDEDDPVPMILTCPSCNRRHIDEGEFSTKVHHTHACQNCGLVWRPAIVATVGVEFLPGFRNDVAPTLASVPSDNLSILAAQNIVRMYDFIPKDADHIASVIRNAYAAQTAEVERLRIALRDETQLRVSQGADLIRQRDAAKEENERLRNSADDAESARSLLVVQLQDANADNERLQRKLAERGEQLTAETTRKSALEKELERVTDAIFAPLAKHIGRHIDPVEMLEQERRDDLENLNELLAERDKESAESLALAGKAVMQLQQQLHDWRVHEAVEHLGCYGPSPRTPPESRASSGEKFACGAIHPEKQYICVLYRGHGGGGHIANGISWNSPSNISCGRHSTERALAPQPPEAQPSGVAGVCECGPDYNKDDCLLHGPYATPQLAPAIELCNYPGCGDPKSAHFDDAANGRGHCNSCCDPEDTDSHVACNHLFRPAPATAENVECPSAPYPITAAEKLYASGFETDDARFIYRLICSWLPDDRCPQTTMSHVTAKAHALALLDKIDEQRNAAELTTLRADVDRRIAEAIADEHQRGYERGQREAKEEVAAVREQLETEKRRVDLILSARKVEVDDLKERLASVSPQPSVDREALLGKIEGFLVDQIGVQPRIAIGYAVRVLALIESSGGGL